ncbi:27752_t:CDS:2 [Dentiscutata erythropus]|uniref:27752_t:CDS:1 n=1 Tax=Dentiscutata erythropus TaxID=1348616 RepID=A0A9N9FEC0_9GLOM|nr:27752_t:CDS:2 [Dentiscutata erythropus]
MRKDLQTSTQTQQQFLLNQQNLFKKQPSQWQEQLPLQQQLILQEPLEQQKDFLISQESFLQVIQQSSNQLHVVLTHQQTTQQQQNPINLLQAFNKILSDQEQFINQHQQLIQEKQNSVNVQINKANCLDCENDYVITRKDVYNAYIQRHQDHTYLTNGHLKAILVPNNVNDAIESENNDHGWPNLFWSNSNQLQDHQNLQSEYQYLKTNYDKLQKNSQKYQNDFQETDSADQLSKDILTLHNSLDTFCGLKRGVEIYESEVKELLKRFGRLLIGDIRNNKNLISGLLERHVIETVIDKCKEYFKENNKDDEQDNDQRLEAKIVKTTDQLLKLATTTKLWQQVYSVLGNRGFSNIKENKKHQLIVNLGTEVAELMNRYRKFKDQKNFVENEKMIDEIVKQIVNIFLFRLKVQEPVVAD